MSSHPKDRSNDDAMVERFQQDPAYAVELLNDILRDGEVGDLLIMLRILAKAFGGVAQVAEAAGLNETTIYRLLSENGNPYFRSMKAILAAMGLRLSVVPIDLAEASIPEAVEAGAGA